MKAARTPDAGRLLTGMGQTDVMHRAKASSRRLPRIMQMNSQDREPEFLTRR
jgi:hypothetical protein